MNRSGLYESIEKWSLADYMLLAIVIAGAAVLFCSGLSIRSLWGSEGRWAVIAREMMQNGNYFLPTINGQVYFDKPLLSYWAIVPFSWFTGVTETSARLPGALASVGTTVLIFMLGRRLYGRAAGFLSAIVLITTAMFGFWSRTASAEILNVLAIWLMLSVLARGDRTPSFPRYLAFYLIAAISAFCKGPVAPAVALATTTALSFTEMIAGAGHDGRESIGRTFTRYFDWILSLKGFIAAVCGLVVFAFLLFLPVIATGSWSAVELMWRENVTRFIKPFDHVEPFYTYFRHVPIFILPWTIAGIASLFYIKEWEAGWTRRWMICVTAAIFVFFTVSGSRRSYYILPIVPAFALVTGTSLARFLYREDAKRSLMRASLVITSILPIIAGIAMTVAYFAFGEYRHVSEIILGPVIFAAGTLGTLLMRRRKLFPAIGIVVVAFFLISMWGFTAGAVIGERQRTLRAFAGDLQEYLRNVDHEKIAMYDTANSSLIFYLGMPEPIRTLDESAVCAYLGEPGNHVLTEEARADELPGQCGVKELVRVLTQPGEGKKHDGEGLVLLRKDKGA